MSDSGDWNVQQGKKNKKGKGQGSPKKGNENGPQTANGPGNKPAKEKPSSKKNSKSEQGNVNDDPPANDGSCPWLSVADQDDAKDDPRIPQSTDSDKSPNKKKRNKKNKNKPSKSEQGDTDITLKTNSTTTQPEQSNGAKSDSGETSALAPEVKSESEEARKELDRATIQEDDGAPMSWEETADEPDPSTKDVTSEENAKKEKETTEGKPGKRATENTHGEESSKKRTKSDERKKISFTIEQQGSKLQQTTLTSWKTEGKHAQPDSSRKSRKDDSNKGTNKESQRSGSKNSSERKSTGSSRESSSTRQRMEEATGGYDWTTNKSNNRRNEPQNQAQGHVQGQQAKKKKGKREPIQVPKCEGFEMWEINEDLFQCDVNDAMAHCVSQDLEMGKGIAVEFKKRFHGVGDLKQQDKKVGETAVLFRDNNYVYYLITKPQYFMKPTYQSLRSSLFAMRDHCVQNKVASLAMPQIGCGLDRLDWNNVTEIIQEVFKNTGITVKIYYI